MGTSATRSPRFRRIRRRRASPRLSVSTSSGRAAAKAARSTTLTSASWGIFAPVMRRSASGRITSARMWNTAPTRRPVHRRPARRRTRTKRCLLHVGDRHQSSGSGSPLSPSHGHPGRRPSVREARGWVRCAEGERRGSIPGRHATDRVGCDRQRDRDIGSTIHCARSRSGISSRTLVTRCCRRLD